MSRAPGSGPDCPLPCHVKRMWADSCSSASPAPAVPLSCPRTGGASARTGLPGATVSIPGLQTAVASLARWDPVLPTAR